MQKQNQNQYLRQSQKTDIIDLNSTPKIQQSQNMASLVKTNSNISNNNNNNNNSATSSPANLNQSYNNNTNNNNNNNYLLFQNQQISPNHSKHLYHNLYSSPTKQDMKIFIPPLNNNINSNSQTYHQSHNHTYSSNSSSPIKNKNNKYIEDNSDLFSTPVKQKQKKVKICKVCSKPIIGTLVRAMGNIYHVNCFTCYDCHKPCSDKFFAADIKVDENGNSISNTVENREPEISNKFNKIEINKNFKIINVPLCEYDYFKRIDLICFTCNHAIRGSYITALGHKYHSDHFFCEICHKVFESDNYYAKDGKIYCHYHYSKLYAFHCESCKCAIIKQYVEIFRGGKQQQWHPECFMVHKFWNVDITVNTLGLGINSIDEVLSNPDKLYKVETNIEKLTITIWLTLSEFEESCASLISEMLHTATTNNKSKGLIVTSKLIFKIRCLFKSIESLFKYSNLKHLIINYNLPKYQNYSQLIKEPRSLTSKIMSYLTFLRDIDSEKLTINKYSHELLSLISTIAHFIKLISRNALMHALESNRLSNSIKPTEILLTEISNHENYPVELLSLNSISSKASDLCTNCNNSIEDDCILFKLNDLNEKRWHIKCFHCTKCPDNKQISLSDLSESAYNIKSNDVLCPSCAASDVNAQVGFQLVSRFMQLAYLLEIAIIRSKIVIIKRERKIHSKQSSDSNISILNDSKIINENNDLKKNLIKKDNNLNKNNKIILNSTNKSTISSSENDSYENKVTEITRRRSLREARKLNNANREIRKSIILEAPIASSASTEEIMDNKKHLLNTNKELSQTIQENDSSNHKNSLNKTISHDTLSHSGFEGSKKLLVQDLSTEMNSSINNKINKNFLKNQNQHIGPLNAALTSKLLQNESSLTLDDIPRIVSSEQAREHRPNAFRFQKRDYVSAISTLPVPKAVKTKDNSNERLSASQVTQNTTTTTTTTTNNNNNNNNNNIQNKIPTSVSMQKKSTSISYNRINGKRYSELNGNAHEYMRHIAAFALYDLFSNKMTLEECAGMIDVKKSHSFWEKLFGSAHNTDIESKTTYNNLDFKSGSATIAGSGKGVFGVPLNTLVSKYGVDSDLGVGSHKVRIPILVDELINVMKTQDVSVEGVFRLNGNIRKLRQLVETIETHPDHIPKLENETPIQLAAVLKKFLRDLPVPLLTFKLYDLFLLPQRLGTGTNAVEDDIKLARKRERILKLAYAMLPKPNRDLAEVLFAFLSWVSTFANIDDDDENMGSKMDTHNLATVITPNILYANVDKTGHSKNSTGDKDGADLLGLVNTVGGENQFLAIEVVNEMIEMNDELSIVPDDLLKLYKLSGFHKECGNDNEKNERDKDKDKEKEKNMMYTKDIMTKLKSVVESHPGVLHKF